MSNDRARALILVGTLAAGGFIGVRAPAPVAPVPPAEVRLIQLPPAAPLAEVAPPVEKIPVPAPRPKIDSRPTAKPKPAAKPLKKSLPSCAEIKREYKRMSLSEQIAAYRSASAEEIAHGKRCLGF